MGRLTDTGGAVEHVRERLGSLVGPERNRGTTPDRWLNLVLPYGHHFVADRLHQPTGVVTTGKVKVLPHIEVESGLPLTHIEVVGRTGRPPLLSDSLMFGGDATVRTKQLVDLGQVAVAFVGDEQPKRTGHRKVGTEHIAHERGNRFPGCGYCVGRTYQCVQLQRHSNVPRLLCDVLLSL